MEDYKLQKLQIPSLEQLLDSRDIPNYPYQKTFEQAKDDPIFVLHTSGSTGHYSLLNSEYLTDNRRYSKAAHLHAQLCHTHRQCNITSGTGRTL
jgi:hypothetical protein